MNSCTQLASGTGATSAAGVAPPRGYRICTRCVMDTSDPGIEFDVQGICNRCREFELIHAADAPPIAQRRAKLEALVQRIRREGRGREYDCIIGVSGGVDSTYTAYLVRQLGLRPLAVHLDNGWDSELAVANIEKCLKRLQIDLHTVVLDWDEFRELQLAFLRASTPDSEAPTDHAIMSCLKIAAAQRKIPYLLMGTNIATEGMPVSTWSSGQLDWRYIKGLNKRFGTRKLRTYPHCSLLGDVHYRYVLRQRYISILDYVDYSKKHALEVLKRELGYEPYAGKHHESVYTRFHQAYILPTKFKFEKRRAHLSPLIMSRQITRAEALEELRTPIMPAEQVRQDKAFVVKKLGITERQFDDIMALPVRTFWDYPSNEKLLIVRIRRALLRSLRLRRARRAAAKR